MKMKYVILNDAACDKRIKKLGAEVAYFSKKGTVISEISNLFLPRNLTREFRADL